MDIRPHLIYYSILTVLFVVVIFVCLYYYIQTLEAVIGGAYAKIFIFENNSYNVSFLWLLGIILIGGIISYFLDIKTSDYLDQFYLQKHIDFIYLPLQVMILLLISEELLWLGSGISGISEILGIYSEGLSPSGILNFLIPILITLLFVPTIYILRIYYGRLVYQDTTTPISYLLSKIPKISTTVPITAQTPPTIQPVPYTQPYIQIQNHPIISNNDQVINVEIDAEPDIQIKPQKTEPTLQEREYLTIQKLAGITLKNKDNIISVKLKQEEIRLILLLSKTYIMDLPTAAYILDLQTKEQAVITRLKKLKAIELINIEKFYKTYIICLDKRGYELLSETKKNNDLKKYINGEIGNMKHHLYTTSTLVYLYYNYKLEFISAIFEDIKTQIEYKNTRNKKAIPDIILTWKNGVNLYKEGIEIELNSTRQKIHEKFQNYTETTDCNKVMYYVRDEIHNKVRSYCQSVPYPANKLKYEIHKLSEIHLN